MAGIYNFPVQIEGDSLKGRTFVLKYFENAVLKDLSTATITMEVYRSKTSKTYLELSSDDPSEILITDPAGCVVKIQEQNANPLTDGEYHYLIRCQWSDGFIHTFLGGKYPVKKIVEQIDPLLT